MVYRHIRELREDQDLTQAAMAEILGIAQNSYSQLENGINRWTPEYLIRLADFYGVSVDYLLDRTKEKTPYPRWQTKSE